MHAFEAGPRGARFVDLVCSLSDEKAFSYLEIGEEPVGDGGLEFEARWSR